MKNKLPILFLMFLLSFGYSFGQVKFEISYSTGRNDQARAIAQTFDKGYVVTGSTVNYNGNTDVYLIKVDELGTFQWAKRFGNSGMDWGQDIIETADSGLAIIGYGHRNGVYDMYFIRTDKNGDTLFTKYFGEAGWDFGYSLKQTSDLGFIIAGETYLSGNSQGSLVKLNANGSIAWKKTFGGTNSDKFEDIIISNSGDFIMAGETKSFGNDEQAYIVKTTNSGVLIWEKNYGSPGINFAKSIVEQSTGNLVFTGGATSVPYPDVDGWSVKLNSLGTQIEEHFIPDFGTSFPYDQNDDWNENVIIYGADSLIFSGQRTFKNVNEGNININRYTSDIVASGYIDDFQKFISFNLEIVYDAVATTDGGAIFACTGDFLDSSASSILLIKLDSSFTYPHPYGNSISFQNDYTSIPENKELKTTTIYPNPSKGKASIDFSGFDNELINVDLYTYSGKIVRRFTSNNDKFTLDLTDMTDGIYFVRIISDNFISTKKLVLTK